MLEAPLLRDGASEAVDGVYAVRILPAKMARPCGESINGTWTMTIDDAGTGDATAVVSNIEVAVDSWFDSIKLRPGLARDAKGQARMLGRSMSLLSRLLGLSRPTVAAPPPPMASTDPRASSPLVPAFDRGSSSFQSQINRAMSAAKSLGDGYYAAKMEVGVANAAAQPTFYGYGTGKAMTMSLTKALPDDRLDLVVCMNVSGHDFKDANKVPLPDALEKKTARAKDNRYVIQVTHADGRKELMKGIGADGQFSTAQDISIKGLQPGKTTLEAWPEGSAGVGGYVEGRRLEITYAPPGRVTDSFG